MNDNTMRSTQLLTNLPRGWTCITLSDHIQIAARIGWRGLKAKEYTNEGPLLIAVKDILPDGKINYDVTDHLSEFRYNESPEIQLRENDILITKDGTIGRIGFVERLPQKATVNSSILVVRPSVAILAKYLFYYFRSPSFQKIVYEKIAGTAVPHLFQRDIKKFEINVPPYNEQRRIVSKLEELFTKLDAGITALNSARMQLKQYRQSVLKYAFEGKLIEKWKSTHKDQLEFTSAPSRKIGTDKVKEFQRNQPSEPYRVLKLPDRWYWAPINLLCDKIQDGAHYSPKIQYSEYSDGRYMYITAKNVKEDGIDLSDITYIDAKVHKEIYARCNPEFEDVLLVKDGVKAGIATINTLEKEFSLLSSVALFKCNKDILNPALLHN